MNNISDETLKKYAEMAAEAFMDDPVYKYVTKKEKNKKKGNLSSDTQQTLYFKRN